MNAFCVTNVILNCNTCSTDLSLFDELGNLGDDQDLLETFNNVSKCSVLMHNHWRHELIQCQSVIHNLQLTTCVTEPAAPVIIYMLTYAKL